jgi:hypothetical protein
MCPPNARESAKRFCASDSIGHGWRTRIRNRIHALVDRQRELEMPQCSDLFGRKGSLEEASLERAGCDAAARGATIA